MIEPKLVSKMRPESSLGSCTMKVPRPSWATRRSLVSTARPLQPSWTWRGTTPLVLGASVVRIRIWAGRKLWRRHTEGKMPRNDQVLLWRCGSAKDNVRVCWGARWKASREAPRAGSPCMCSGIAFNAHAKACNYWGQNMGPSCSGRSSWTKLVRNGAHMSMDRGQTISWLLELAESATASWRASCMAGRAKLTVCLIS